MTPSLTFVGLDVDDTAFHIAFVCSETAEEGYFSCRPNTSALQAKLKELQNRGFTLQICYEATYLGFSLHRELSERGFACEVIAPSLIPELAGKLQKTDRLDAKKLAQFYSKNLLTVVHVPDQQDEAARDLIRARQFASQQLRATKVYILSLCRRYGLNPKQDDSLKRKTWSDAHKSWLRSKLNDLPRPARVAFDALLFQLEQTEAVIVLYEAEIEQLSQDSRYKKRVDSLTAFRGIDKLSGMTLVTEIGDVKRFVHPSKLVSYAGMDLREYSSGGKERRYSITRLGNKHIRTTLVESSQYALKRPQISRSLKQRRERAEPDAVVIADRCMLRLYQKGNRLLRAGKPTNKVKVACAREMLCFVWETLQKVS